MFKIPFPPLFSLQLFWQCASCNIGHPLFAIPYYRFCSLHDRHQFNCFRSWFYPTIFLDCLFVHYIDTSFPTLLACQCCYGEKWLSDNRHVQLQLGWTKSEISQNVNNIYATFTKDQYGFGGQFGASDIANIFSGKFDILGIF